VLGIELIGRFGKVPSELGGAMQVNTGGGGRVMTDLEIFQTSVVEVGSQEKLLSL
jgi:hypothetical protein